MLLIANSTQQPWNSPLSTLNLLQNCKSVNDINQIHARLVTTGFIRDNSVTTKLVLSLSSSPIAPLVEFARYIFFSRHAFCVDARNGDPFLWNAVIKSYSHGDDPIEALFVFNLMLESGVCVDKFSFSLILKACSRLGLIREGIQIQGLLWKLGFRSDCFLLNCLLTLYTRCCYIEHARHLFDTMPMRDSVSFNIMIDGYVKCGEIELAHELFEVMPMKARNLITWNCLINGYINSPDGLDIAWELFDKMPQRDLISWNLMIGGCAKQGRMKDAQALFDRMPKRDMISWANIIDGYAKLGNVNVARKFFNQMPERDVIVCNVMMSGYVRNGFCREALDIFHYMQNQKNLCPDNATLLIALSAIAQLGKIDKGVEIHCYIKELGLCQQGKIGVALIDMYSKCGSIENATSVFEGIKAKTVDHYNAMIGALAVFGLGESAIDFLMEMKRVQIKPDDITFIGLLNACSHAGLVKEGMISFDIMRRVYQMEPKLQHYGCMVDIFSRAGHIEEARNFVDQMPVAPNDVIWRTLVSACKMHETFDVGEPLAEHLMSVDSSSSSSYVLLSNMYAGRQMWDSASRVRTVMKERKLQKVPGFSWIELEGCVHEFSVQDKTHPRVEEIYSLLDSHSLSMFDSGVLQSV